MTIHEITDTRRMEIYMRFASVDGRLAAMLLALLFALSVFSLPSSANQSNGTSAVQFVDVSAAVGLAVIDPGPDAQVLREVALSAPLPGIGILHGTIDRLIVTANRILAVDYKSNATVPATPEAAPDGILRQLPGATSSAPASSAVSM